MDSSPPSMDEPPPEGEDQTPRGGLRSLIGRYAIHMLLLAVALGVAVFARSNPGLIEIDLPAIQAGTTAVTLTPTAEGVTVPTFEPTVIADRSLRRAAIPHTYEPDLPTLELAYHQVEEGDTPNSIAETYGIEPSSLLWANPNLSDEAQLLQVGITLTILPVNGVLHTVEVSDTVDSIAEYYGVEPEVVIAYGDNHLENWPHRPMPGTQIIVPGGEKPFLVWSYTPNTVRGRTSASAFYDGPIIAAGYGSFIWPADSWRITQYYWYGHRAIDIGGATGTSVYASDSGTVVYAGWSPVGYGNLLVLDHGNGFVTYYAHLDSFWVSSGQWVVQGTPIAGIGSTGNSTGPHLHFEIRYGGNLLNPLDYLWE